MAILSCHVSIKLPPKISDGQHLPQSFGPDAAVREGDLAILARNDPVITDRHSEDVRGEVAQRGSAVAGSLRVDHPVALPNRRVDQVKQVLACQDAAELAAEEDGQRLLRHEEVSPGGQPATAILVDAAPRHDVVHVRVIVQCPAPCV